MLEYQQITRNWLHQNLGECLWLHKEWDREAWLRELPGKFELSRAIYLDGVFIGVMIVSRKECPHLHLLKIKMPYRALSYGRQSFDKLLFDLRQNHDEQLTWKVHRDNERAIKFYQAHNPTQVEDGDHYLMTKQLNQKVVTIHQPNFTPWVPFFEKIRAADVYVVLSRCDYSKGGYQNRFSIGNKWYTMPVKSYSLGTPIADMQYVDAKSSWEWLKLKLPKYCKVLQQFDDCISSSTLQCNLKIILRACELLGINTQVVMDQPTTASGTARLVELVKQHDGDIYLSGRSGHDYMDESLLTEAGIEVQYQAKPSRPVPLVEYLPYCS